LYRTLKDADMKNSILLQNVSPEELSQLIADGIKTHLSDFKALLNTHDPDEILTREETCKFLQIDSSTLWAWTKKGKVQSFGIANRRYYKKAELLNCLKPVKN
jgi:predicted oxidoreductase